MYKYYNAHPRSLSVGDCVKRAIAVAAQMDYADVQRALNRYKKVTGAKSFNSDKNPHKYVENVLKAEQISFPAADGKRQMTGAKFCEAYPTGRYILDMPSHWSCCVDGVIYDTWDCSAERVRTAYRVTPQSDVKRYKYCCTVHAYDASVSVIRIYDGNGQYAERKVETALVAGYIRCLEDEGYPFVKF